MNYRRYLRNSMNRPFLVPNHLVQNWNEVHCTLSNVGAQCQRSHAQTLMDHCNPMMEPLVCPSWKIIFIQVYLALSQWGSPEVLQLGIYMYLCPDNAVRSRKFEKNSMNHPWSILNRGLFESCRSFRTISNEAHHANFTMSKGLLFHGIWRLHHPCLFL